VTLPYYGSQTRSSEMSLQNLYQRLGSLYLLFKDKDFFKQKSNVTSGNTPSSFGHDAVTYLGFNPFPTTRLLPHDMTGEMIFRAFEFLYDRVSKPGEWGEIGSSSGFTHEDYYSYDVDEGRREYKDAADAVLRDWKDGFQLNGNGRIETLGTGGLEYIFAAAIVPFDEANVDSKVRTAVSKYRGRHATDSDKKEAVRILADVFEYLKKSSELKKALADSDSSDLFHIANKFAIRHHDPAQKGNYDTGIWYAWMFHFYLATYHAAIRLIIKKAKSKSPRVAK
jgi:hypothetical protein